MSPKSAWTVCTLGVTGPYLRLERKIGMRVTGRRACDGSVRV